MIGRIWHGYTTFENADAYFAILTAEVVPGIVKMNIAGFKSIQVLKRRLDDEIEFLTIMWFESIESIKSFTGEDYEVAHVPPRAREVLKRFDSRSDHYELVREFEGC